MDPSTAPPDDSELQLTAKFPGMGEIVGALAALAPFFFHVTESSSNSVTINDQVVASTITSFDYVAMVGGAIALVMALVGFVRLGATPKSNKTKRLIASAAIALVGALQLARGFGKI
jgi:hypothetical protein